jgi:hypothetical protein
MLQHFPSKKIIIKKEKEKKMRLPKFNILFRIYNIIFTQKLLR